jgi:putative ABC transport system permease protein
VNFTEGLRIAVDSIIANPLRSFLTLLGIVMGVTAIIAVVAIINGLNLYVEDRIIRLGPSSFEINRFGIITNREQFLKAIRRNPVLEVADANALRDHMTLAEKIAVKVGDEADVKYGRRVLRSVWLRGITPEILEIEPYEIESGRGIAADDNDRAAMVAFLGADLADELFGALDPIGKEIKIHGRSFETVGVAARRGSVFGQSRDNYVTIPLSTFQKIHGRREPVAIVIRATSPAVVEEAMDEARVILRARHHLRYSEPDDFGIVNAEAMNALWRDMSSAIFNVALFVVGISLVVGGIVIMNIMLVSVIERTAEIGVRKAAGARHRDIRRQFLTESAVLAAAGGLIGLLLAYGATVAIRNFSPFPAAFPWWAPVLALTISSAVGITFGLYPAAKAARLNPIEALRSQ